MLSAYYRAYKEHMRTDAEKSLRREKNFFMIGSSLELEGKSPGRET